MRNIALLSPKERENLFINTENKAGMNRAIIEKDFWVCWTLDYLFTRSKWKDSLVFKGGTSLSKAFGLIKRFSEDIDLILDWRVLGYGDEEPWNKRSVTGQDRFNKTMNHKAEILFKEQMLPDLERDFSEELKCPISLYIDENTPQVIRFIYPRLFSEGSILQEICLEIGPLAKWFPTVMKTIVPYASQYYPQAFSNNEVKVLTVPPERTFWEKATILHSEAHRPETKHIPDRYSRHYYDMFCMQNSEVRKNAIQHTELLEQTAIFKDRFSHSGWSSYETARIGTLNLIPSDKRLVVLADDYEHMGNMIFGAKPLFSEIIESLRALEKEINSLS